MMSTMHDIGWHQPRFTKLICGEMSDRERLGLPDHYLESRFDASLPAAIDALRGLSSAALLEIVRDSGRPLVQRIAAGNVLALIGDPRISIDDPEMILIPRAAVEIGLPWDKVDPTLRELSDLGIDAAWIEKECPRHRVTLESYAIARFPVTNIEYRAFLLDTRYSELPTSWEFRRFPLERANHPVYTVTDGAAKAYASWLSRRTGRRFRLPTESEWEYAAAGPQGREFPWGDEFDADLANTAETALFCTSAVGVFAGGESPFGVSDMAGNVEEYVADSYVPYPGGKYIADHLTANRNAYTVARGGSFARFRDLARTRRRHGHNPRSATYAMGFRLAEDVT